MKLFLENKSRAFFAATAWSPWLQAVVFGLAYFASARFSNDIAGTQDYIISCWLPSGLFLGMLLLTAPRHWLGLVLAGGLGDLAYNYSNPGSWTLTFLLLAHLGNSASAVMGAWLVRRYVAARPTLGSVRELFGLLVFGGLLSIPLSATIGTLLVSAASPEGDWLLTWSFWFFSDLLGVMLLTPVLLAWWNDIRWPTLWRLTPRFAEAAGLWLGAGVTLGLSYYFHWPKLIFPLFVVIPYIIWAIFRFGLRGVSVTLLFSVLLAEWFIDQGYGMTGSSTLSATAVNVERLVGFGGFSLLGLFPAVMLAEQRRAEKDLRENEARLRAIIDHEPECVKLVDPDGLLLEMNPAGLRMIGADTLAEVQNRSVYPLIAAEHRAAFRALHHQVLRGESGELQFDVIGLKGTRRTLETHATPLRDAAGAVTAVLGLTRDITARLETDAALRKSEANLTAAQALARLGSWEYLPATGQFFWSAELFRIFQLDPAQGVPSRERILGILHPADRIAFQRTHDMVRATAVQTAEFRLLFPDGRIAWIEDRSESVYDATGQLVSIIGTTLDITERKLTEARIREQADLLNQTHDAIMVADLDNRFTFWNEGAERITGWSAAEALGQTAESTFNLVTDARRAAIRETVLTTGAWQGEMPIRRKDGRTALLDLRITLVRDAAGQPKGRLSIATDITEKKQMEEQLLRVQRLESLGMLAAGIAHDLNNILSPVLMAAPLLRTRATHPSDLRVLDLVEKSAERGGALVRQILSFAHGVEGEKIRVQPAHLLHEIGALISDTFPKTVRLESEIAPDLRTVLVNPTHLHQILLNLCINARDAMPGGGTLSLRARNASGAEVPAGLPSGDYIVLEVADTGTGMTPEVLAGIWEPFFTTKGEGRGTGLGLATVRGIVNNLQGGITVNSAPSYGSTFRIWLPAAKELSTHPFSARPNSRSPLPGQGELVVVVDDEAAVRELITQVLTAAGYRILSARDGGELFALHYTRLQEVSLVLMDIGLPDQDGLSLARILQRARPDQRILFITGYTDASEEASRALPAGLPLLKKPFTGADLLGAVQRALLAPGISLAAVGPVPERATSPTRHWGTERPPS